MSTILQYPWHPIYNQQKEIWNFDEYNHHVTLLSEFRNNLSMNSFQYPVKDLKRDDLLYEVELFNVFHPNKLIFSYPWVFALEREKWWPSDQTLQLFEKYGWKIKILP